jgi:ribulose 1,5-bisphosphate synthetase/thiazole synthase
MSVLDRPTADAPDELDVLVVGDGPTGLTPAGQLARINS